MTNVKTLTTGLIAGATLFVAASPAEAQYRYYRNRGGDRTALAIGAGALGLAVGAALTSNNRRGGYWNERGYYGRNPGYGYGRNWGYAPRGYAYGYGRGRGFDGYYGRGRTQCWTDRQWDDWRGRWRRVRVCDRF